MKVHPWAQLISYGAVLLTSSTVFASPIAYATSNMDSARVTLDSIVYVADIPTTTVPLGKPFSVKYVADNVEMTGPYSVVWKMYSDGSLVWSQTSDPITKSGGYTRKFAKASFPPGTKKVGPFYLCVSAVNGAGQKSRNAPCSNVLWIGIEVPLQKVSNGCGGQLGLKFVDKWMQKSWDTQVIDGEKVTFKPACDIHDAGYSGVTVKNPFMGNNLIDYRTITRKQVDDYFSADLQGICMNHPKIVMKCMTYSLKYYEAVRSVGYWFFDADPTVPTSQAKYVELKGRTSAPLRVGRTNN